jgi:hypothetical protein
MKKRQLKKKLKGEKIKAVLTIDAKNITPDSTVFGYISKRFVRENAEQYVIHDRQKRKIDYGLAVRRGFTCLCEIRNAKYINFEFLASDNDKSYYVIYPPKEC